jgi:predicted ATP-grasp superfamily ATP-dependent carboligase
VHAIDSSPKQPIFQTVYGKAHLCPDSDGHPFEWLEFMIGLSAEIGGKPVLISSSDKYVTAMADHAGALDPHFTFCQSSIAAQALLATKKRQYAIADDLGLPVPATRFVESQEDVRAFARTASFPAILKPLHFREWKEIAPDHPLFEKKLIVAANAEELERQYARTQRNWSICLATTGAAGASHPV